ncbi:scoF [Symbiodinium pilosum]|uniref:ScoF protein n=1 Tax=Symbiodinium pilosum TaxID=2952 RepID=A0A812PZS3_SYMPI|nr:scoF [Symbiodinium pilosum]
MFRARLATDALDSIKQPVTAEEAYEEAKSLLRYPVDSITEGLMKKFEITDVDAKTFVVKVIIDGQKLDKWGYGKGDGTDRVRHWKKVVMDDANMSLTIQDFVPEAALGAWVDEATDKEAYNTCILQVEKSPPRILIIFDDKDGKRLSDEGFRDVMYTWTDGIVSGVQTYKTAKVKVKANAPSLVEEGKESMVSEPMDAHVKYDKFWDKHLQYCKDFVKNVSAPGSTWFCLEEFGL